MDRKSCERAKRGLTDNCALCESNSNTLFVGCLVRKGELKNGR